LCRQAVAEFVPLTHTQTVTTPRSAPSDGQNVVVRDFWPRLLLSPIIGAVIPNLAGFIDNARYSAGEILAHYVYFWFVAFTIWEGNRRLHDRFRSRFAWFEQPWMRIGLLLGTITLFTVPMTWGLLWLWGRLSGDPSLTAPRLLFAIVVTVMLVVVIAHVYETLFMFQYWERDRLSKERLERTRLQAELDALQRDVDPHFLYNSLNSLLQLIETKPQRAMAFVEALAATYRYVVDTRGRALVSLIDELGALERQRVLAEIRFADSVRFDDAVDRAEARRWNLPPLVLQELFENAVKHNAFDRHSPLDVRIECEGSDLLVSNRFRPRLAPIQSTRLGLRNLDERMRLAVGRPLQWGIAGDRFVVRVPLAQAEAVAQPATDRVGRQIAS
jgi:two-component system LytT family sensor kinase